MTYIELLIQLSVAVWLFILALVIFRRYLPGDYTVVKVIAGVAIVLIAQYQLAEAMGLTTKQAHWLLLGPMAVGGFWITLWQFAEWVRRFIERQHARIAELERRDEPA